MSPRILFPMLAAGLAVGVTGASSQTRHVPSFRESLEIQTPSAPQISPDGAWVLYGVRETDWKQDAYVTHLWLVNTRDGRRFQLTRGAQSSGAARWSPDSRWIAFTAERPAGADATPATPGPAAESEAAPKPAPRQLWVISPAGGEAWQLTRHLTNVEDFRWSPDGRRIAFSAAAKESDAAKQRKKRYGDYSVFEHDFTQTQLWSVDAAAGEHSTAPAAETPLVEAAQLNVGGFAWSPDGRRIAFSATPNPILADGSESDIYLTDAEPGAAPRQIVALAGPDTNPVFSPDGSQLAFNTALAQPHNFYANQHIATVTLDAVLAHGATVPADVRDLTASFDEDPHLIAWGPDDLYFSANQKTTAQVFRLPSGGGAAQRITAADTYHATGASFTRDFQHWAFLTADATHMPEVAVSATAIYAPRVLTAFNAQLAAYTQGSAEVIQWTSGDGTTIEGVLHKPADFQPGRKYPLLVVIHGGPTGVSTAALNPVDSYYPIQRFLARGALVLEPNYRGSAGYGAKFRALNVRNLGVGDMADVMSGVDALIARGLVDPAHMGAMGWSEGGYISAFLTTHTARFQAISVGAGISDWMTYYVSTDITPFTRQYLLATPWSDPAIYARTSPITTITQARTPTLIQQGSEDKRVPVPDSFELYRGLQDQHVPSRLIFYTGYGHPITKPKSNLAVVQSNWDWFSHYLWGDPIPAESPLDGSSELPAASPTRAHP